MQLICSVVLCIVKTTAIKCNILQLGCYDPVKPHDLRLLFDDGSEYYKAN